MTDTDIENVDLSDGEVIIDRDAIEKDIAAGVRAYSNLLKHASEDWNSWAITIVGLRGLRDLIANIRSMTRWTSRRGHAATS